MMHLRSKHVFALIGLGFGLLVIHYGLFKAVFVAALVAVGWFVGRVLDGEADVSDYIGSRRRDDLE